MSHVQRSFKIAFYLLVAAVSPLIMVISTPSMVSVMRGIIGFALCYEFMSFTVRMLKDSMGFVPRYSKQYVVWDVCFVIGAIVVFWVLSPILAPILFANQYPTEDILWGISLAQSASVIMMSNNVSEILFKNFSFFLSWMQDDINHNPNKSHGELPDPIMCEKDNLSIPPFDNKKEIPAGQFYDACSLDSLKTIEAQGMIENG